MVRGPEAVNGINSVRGLQGPPGRRGRLRVHATGRSWCLAGAACLLAIALLHATRIQAQPQRITLIPATVGDKTQDISALEAPIAAALRAQAVEVIALDEARALFEARHSAEAERLSDSDIDIVADEARAALLHVATGRTARARSSIAEVLERAEKALEYLNRTNDSARHVLNACLYLVRAMAESGNRESALAKVAECRRLVPDIAPDSHDHPPAVISLYREAGENITARPTGSLTVKSTPSGCDAFINGRRLGITPYEVKELPAGEYRVQAECGERSGRVHRVLLAAQATTVMVDADFDRSVRSAKGLGLVYPTLAEAEVLRLKHAAEVSKILGSSHALLVTPEPELRTLRLDLITAEPAAVVASARLPEPAEVREQPNLLLDAVEALLRGESLAFTEASAVAIPPWKPRLAVVSPEAPPPSSSGAAVAQASAAPSQPRGWREPLALGLLTGTGLVLAGTAIWLQVETSRRADSFRDMAPDAPDFLTRQADFDRGRLGTVLTHSASSAVLLSSLPFWHRYGASRGRTKPGVLHWTLGGAGVAAFATGVYFAAKGPDCLDARCTRREPDRLIGAALMLHALPLIGVPLVKLWKIDTHSKASQRAANGQAAPPAPGQVQVEVGAVGPGVGVRGSF